MKKKAAKHPSTTAPKKRIFIVEDHPVFREGLVQILNGENDLIVCGEAGSAEQALGEITRLSPDLALVDITLPGRSGLDLIKSLRARQGKVKVLVISMHDEAIYADRVLRAGSDGYIMKQEDPEEIIHAIRDVLNGHIYVSEEVLASHPKKGARKPVARTPLRPLEDLTDGELEVLEALGQGKSCQEIARQFRWKARTVETHCTRIRKKLRLKSTNALIRYAVCWLETEGK